MQVDESSVNLGFSSTDYNDNNNNHDNNNNDDDDYNNKTLFFSMALFKTKQWSGLQIKNEQ